MANSVGVAAIGDQPAVPSEGRSLHPDWLNPSTQFPLLYEQEYTRIYRTVRAMVLDASDADDLTQESFARAYRARKKYRPDAPPSAWLHRIAVNTAISHLRRKKLARFFPIKLEVGREDPALARADSRGMVEEALSVLSPKLRAAVVLQYFHDCSREEVAHILHIPSGTVASRIAKAMAQMRQKIEPPPN
ncbi:MAG: RNA polymerase sigma factor [Candidatus Dormibacteraceae bacterium]